MISARKREMQGADNISPADYAIYKEKLGLIREEAKAIFVRSGRAGILPVVTL
jgi:hypothetical protein